MTRRNLELVLLCLAAPIVVLIFAMLIVNQNQSLSVENLGVPIGIFVACIIAHVSIRKFAPSADPAILPIAFALSGIGIAFVTRLAPELATRQLLWLFVGIVAMILVLALFRNTEKLARYKYTLMVLGFLLLLSPMLPGIGTEVLGSRIWLTIGGFSFQPGEVAKVCVVLFLAAYLAQNREMLSVFTWKVGPAHLPDLKTLLPLLLIWVIALLIVIFEKDLGSALVFYCVFLTMLYVATGKKFYLLIGLLLAVIAAVFLYAFFSHVQVRVQTWLDPFADASGSGYQLAQSLFSIADGDLFGCGIGRGLAENIPIVESDFIFAAIAEETGLLGAAGVLLLYLCLCIRGFVVAARAKSDVASFIAVGLTTTIVLQAFIIVGGVTKLIPLTGLTLPFISQGGSSLLASFIAIGFLLRCGNEGTGIGKEMVSGTTQISSDNVLGRIALGKRLVHASFFFALLFAILVANLTVIMVFQADEYKNMDGNTHKMAEVEKTQRGSISTYDGVVLAQSVQEEDGTYSRIYPEGSLASHVVGYTSTTYGTSGIESSYNDTLQGEENFATWTDVFNSMAGIKTPGNDITLTINSEIQKAVEDELEGHAGACVVLDPETGAVLAMASSPTYDANDVESLLASAAAGSNDTSLYNRATQALYGPGSTFKVVSLSTALQNNISSQNTVYNSPGVMDIGNATVSNYGNNSLGSITLRQATAYSSNTVYGQLGVEIGSELLVQGAAAFGFNQDIDFDLPLSTSLMPDPSEMTTWETAWAAAGEPVGEHKSPAGPQATVLQMGLVGCAIANDGTIMHPYLVDSIYNANGQKSYTAESSIEFQAVSAEVANEVKDVLCDVVKYGSGTQAAITGVTVAGKTGTAETSDGNSPWFVGMAPAEDPKVVVAIMYETGQGGETTPAAKRILQKSLQVAGVIQ